MKSGKIRHILGTVVILGLVFQTLHFTEHLVQFGVWLFGDRTTAYMSPVAMWSSHRLGALVVPDDPICSMSDEIPPRQMMVGMEILHLIGNGIFLGTIAAMYYFMRTKLVRYALYVETFHLYEHIMLTLTALFLNQPVGLSTLFGGAKVLWGQNGLVGYRVIWHFAMNLVPSALIMLALKRKSPVTEIGRALSPAAG